MIKVSRLNKKFKNKVIFTNNEFRFEKGKITSIVGMNGSGKTTLLLILLGILPSDGMELQVWSEVGYKMCSRVDHVFFVPSEFSLPEYLTGREYIQFVLGIYRDYSSRHLNLMIELLRFEEHLDKLIDSYSYGMKKKLQMILALSLDVNILIFDEIHSGLDVEATFIFNKLIRKRSDSGVCVIIATHDIHYASTKSDVVYLLEGNGRATSINQDDLESTIERIVLGEESNDRFNEY